jgi:prephenate dehydrogenase
MIKKVVSVYGYGRFGKFWADLLAEDFQVKVYSRRGLKEEEVNSGVQITDAEDIYNCDAIFYCVAISSFEDLLKRSKKLFRKNTVYFDTCSVKVEPARWMDEQIPDDCMVIASHPMFGPDSYFSSPEKLPMVMCKIRVPDEEFNFWKDYFSGKNMRVEIMTPDEHDKMVAYSQGITHYIGRVLADLDLKPTLINTLGYRKLLEIMQQTCNDSWQLFVDLQKYNPYTRNMRIDLHASIERIYSALGENDIE